MFSQKKILVASLAFAALSTIIFAITPPPQAPPSRRPVKITYQYYTIKADGSRVDGNVFVRILADGQMRRQEYRAGKLYNDQYVDRAGELYGVSHKRRELNPAHLPEKFNLSRTRMTPEFMLAQQQYHRTEQILGVTTYVFQIKNDAGVVTNEMWCEPEIDPLTLKEISYRDDGSRNVLEATAIVFGNVGEVRPAGYKMKN